jgi:outer membrane lipoprotein-sorting protein
MMKVKMKKVVLFLCILSIFLTGCVTSSAEKKKDDCPSGVPASGIQK